MKNDATTAERGSPSFVEQVVPFGAMRGHAIFLAVADHPYAL
jgi:hypothetical protein